MRKSFVWVALLFAFGAVPTSAQAPRKSRSASPNVVTGVVRAIDASAATVTVDSPAHAPATFHVTDRTLLLRNKRTADLTAFKAGDGVAVRFRAGQVAVKDLYDLADRPTWDWLQRVRRQVTSVTVKEIDDGSLVATEGADEAPIEYRITAKSRWGRADKAASPDTFKPGDRVFVAPRLLPNGRIMAAAVADTAALCARLKERSAPYVTGVVEAIDLQARTLTIRTVSGDERTLTIAQAVTVRSASKDVPLSGLRRGIEVTAHVVRSSDADYTVARITIKGGKAAAKPAKPATGRNTHP